MEQSEKRQKKLPYLLEVCAVSYQSALAAVRGGAQRVELCSALEMGGLTPSIGTIRKVRSIPHLKVHVLIRPRGGDFCYDEEEKQVMLQDIEAVRESGVDGVVVGGLCPDGSLDLDFMQKVCLAAGSMSITFHRAFDVCSHPLRVLEQLTDLKVNRILSSGGKADAEQGMANLRSYVEEAKGRIVIMGGCGITARNVCRIVRETGISEVHASAKQKVQGSMLYHNPEVLFGRDVEESDSHLETGQEQVRAIVQALAECVG